MKKDRGLQDELRSTRQQMLGEAWWTTKYLSLMKQGHFNQVQIAKGRKTAERGKVIIKALHIGSSDSIVFEAIGGIRKVTLWVVDLEEEWKIVYRILAENQVLYTRLLNGDYAEELDNLLKEAGISIIPGTIMDLDFRCDCISDHVCSHIIATYLALAKNINENPLILFLLRGRSREDIIAGVDSHCNDVQGNNTCGEESRSLPESIRDYEPCEASDMEHYYDHSELKTIRILTHTHAGRESDLFRHLGPSPFKFGKMDMAEIIGECYPKAAHLAEQLRKHESQDGQKIGK